MTESRLLDPRRGQSEVFAFQAEQAWASGNRERAHELFAVAAALEEEVALEVPAASPRLRSLLAISASALWYKAADYDRAKHVAYVFLAPGDGLTKGGRRELEQLVERCSREAELRDVANEAEMVPVEVKLAGGHVGVGIAPAGAAREKGRAVTSLLTRSAELAAKLEYRERGGSDLDRSDQLRIFEAPAIAASYGLRFYVATGSKRGDAKKKVVAPESVVETFLALAGAAASGPDAIRALVPDARYAQAFITGFGDLAPDGEDIERVECSSPTWKMPGAPRTIFELEHRTALRKGSEAEPGVQERKVRARVVAASLTRSTIELEVMPEADAVAAAGAEAEKIEGTVIPRSRQYLHGLRLDDIYEFDLKVTRAADASGSSHVKLEIRSAGGAMPIAEPSDQPRAEARRPAKAVLRWSKPLTATDAQQNEGNHLPYVQLTKSGQPIDHTIWFRETFFADAAWGPATSGEGEEAFVELHVIAQDLAFGKQLLRLSHVASRARHNGQPTTRLHWSGEVRRLIERNDFTRQFLVLQRDKSGRYHLLIADERPPAIV